MLRISDRIRLTVGYIGLRLNYIDHESANVWACYIRRYYHLVNADASDEVIQHYLDTENPYSE